MVKIYSHYAPGPKVKFACRFPSRTQQHFRNECDINNIMKRYLTTGYLTDPMNVSTRKPMFGDFSNVSEFQNAQNVIADAVQAFEAMPSYLRKRFQNNPVLFLEFVNNSDNYDEAVKLGICLPKPVEKTPAKAGDDEPVGEVDEPEEVVLVRKKTSKKVVKD